METMRQKRALEIFNALEIKLKQLRKELCAIKADYESYKIKACAARRLYAKIMTSVAFYSNIHKNVCLAYNIKGTICLKDFDELIAFFEF